MGACRYSNNREVSGEALGYMTGNIVEGEGGTLRLMYSSGERCGGSGRTRMVHVEFQCGPSAGAVSIYTCTVEYTVKPQYSGHSERQPPHCYSHIGQVPSDIILYRYFTSL